MATVAWATSGGAAAWVMHGATAGAVALMGERGEGEGGLPVISDGDTPCSPSRRFRGIKRAEEAGAFIPRSS